MDRGEFFLRSGERTILRDNSYSHWPQKTELKKLISIEILSDRFGRRFSSNLKIVDL